MSHFKKRKHGHEAVKPKNPARNYQKAFGLATFIASTLKPYTIQDKEIAQIHKQCSQVMQEYGRLSSFSHVDDLTDKLGDVWVYLLTRNENTSIKEDDVPALIEAMCMLIHPKEFEDMFGVKPYVRDRHIYYTSYPVIANNVLELDKELNKLLGTKAYCLIKPKQKVIKVKKKRDKSKKTIKAKNKKKRNMKYVEQKAEKKQTLKERIALAKENSDAWYDNNKKQVAGVGHE